jgi:phenylalanine-4-hydroxylase
MNPLFADYMQAYGEAGMKAPGALKHLRRLYRSTVECGLIETDIGLRIYGAGILCCGGEVEFSLESPSPNRIRFDLNRVLRTRRHNGDYQASYFVISDFRDLYEPARRGFAPILRALEGAPDIASGALLPQDELLN